MKKAIIGLAACLVLPVLMVLYVGDQRRAESALERGAMARILAARVYDEQGTAFSLQNINAISGVLEGPRGAVLKAGLDECLKAGPLPRLFGPKAQVIELNIAVGQLVALLKEPRGNWLSYTSEVNSLRTALEGRILALTQALGGAGAQTATQTGGARGAAVIQAAVRAELDAQEREDREKRELMAAAEREMAERDRLTAEDRRRHEADRRDAGLAQEAQTRPYVPQSPTPALERIGGGTAGTPPPSGFIGWSRATPTPIRER
ncbi:MAG: hypothetical protein EDX89_22610 [Acidobacteria bacterium]|nr:MAG: hypothetical protein EDX89_22610 [Acidobacteriota bacterium]